jgi:hypothetical protein
MPLSAVFAFADDFAHPSVFACSKGQEFKRDAHSAVNQSRALLRGRINLNSHMVAADCLSFEVERSCHSILFFRFEDVIY